MELPATKLYESIVCRLCAEANHNGSRLYEPSLEDGYTLATTINKYLPLKVKDDGKLPCILCPGCIIQLEATKSFFDLIVAGQKKLKYLIALEEKQKDAVVEHILEQDQEETALQVMNSVSTLQTYSMGVDPDENAENLFLQIFSGLDLAAPITSEKPKKKRGRPPKPPQRPQLEADIEEQPQSRSTPDAVTITVANPEQPLASNVTRKRMVKQPLKYLDLIQGKELERVFEEEGIDEDIGNDIPQNSRTKFDKSEIEIASNVASNKLQKKFACEVCSRTFTHQSRLDTHKTFHKDIFFQCKMCAMSYGSKEDYEAHVKESQHDGFKLIEYVDSYGRVELPEYKAKDPETSLACERVDSSSELQCDQCDALFTGKQNLEIHYRAVHNNEMPNTCDKCGKQFPHANSYKKHLQQHAEKTYKCDQCDKMFHYPSSLVYHREAEHNNGRKFVCNKCKKCFKHKQLLVRHQLVHTAERPFPCTHCSSAFKTRANLLNHMATHTKEKKFKCTECGLLFSYKTSLNLHQRWHNGQKPFTCEVCQKSFSQKGNLAEHMRIHTGEKPFACTYCGRRFTTSSQYKLHVKRHTGERPWRCEYCEKTFLHKDTWKCHTRRHRNERPFQCSFCLRGFTEQWALKKHERLHTGEKPYSCETCGKSFADSSNLKKHTKIHLRHELANDGKKNKAWLPPSVAHEALFMSYDEVAAADMPGENAGLFTDEMLQAAATDEISIDVQQLVDNDGNGISFTTGDGQHIKVVTTMGSTECIQGLLPDGTLIPINLANQESKCQLGAVHLNAPSELSDMQLLDEDSTPVDKSALAFSQNSICLITSYDVDNSSISFS